MEEACHKLDLESADPGTFSAAHNQGGIAFSHYAEELQQLSELKDDAEKCKHTLTLLEQLSTFCSLTLPEDDQNFELVRKEAVEQRKKLDKMVYCLLPIATMDRCTTFIGGHNQDVAGKSGEGLGQSRWTFCQGIRWGT